mmetsp:Transcript_10962/g.45661  ORF Transcript_10962/g.45661 Transcript_10962/m.45661 type:complete len:219 (+) Transcript_10962:1585-2241(+)
MKTTKTTKTIRRRRARRNPGISVTRRCAASRIAARTTRGSFTAASRSCAAAAGAAHTPPRWDLTTSRGTGGTCTTTTTSAGCSAGGATDPCVSAPCASFRPKPPRSTSNRGRSSPSRATGAGTAPRSSATRWTRCWPCPDGTRTYPPCTTCTRRGTRASPPAPPCTSSTSSPSSTRAGTCSRASPGGCGSRFLILKPSRCNSSARRRFCTTSASFTAT